MPINATTKEVRQARKINNYFSWVKAKRKNLPVRVIYGVKLSFNHGEDWQTKALCDVCIKKIEPPTRLKKEMEAGVGTCDLCGCLNEMWKK